MLPLSDGVGVNSLAGGTASKPSGPKAVALPRVVGLTARIADHYGSLASAPTRLPRAARADLWQKLSPAHDRAEWNRDGI